MRKELFKKRKLDYSFFRNLQLNGYEVYEGELLKLKNLKPEVINEIENPLTGETMNQYYIKTGNPDAKKVVGWFSTHHGIEKAGAGTTLQVLREINNPQTGLMKKFLRDANFVSVPVIDPFGYEVLARLSLNLYTKEEERSPVDPEQPWADTNEWKSHMTKEVESTFKAIKPEFEGVKDKTLEGLIIDSHETVFNEMEYAYKGKWKPAYMVGDSIRRNRGLLIIDDTINYNIARAAASNLLKQNKQPYLMTGMDFWAEKSVMFPQLKIKEDGIMELSEQWRELGVAPFSEWAKSQGINGLTFESFMKTCSSRVEEHMIGGEGAIKYFMGYSTNIFVQDGLRMIQAAKGATKKVVINGLLYAGLGYWLFGWMGALAMGAPLTLYSLYKLKKRKLSPERIITHLANEDISFYPEWIDGKIKNAINDKKALRKVLKECYKKTSKNMVLLEGDKYEMIFTKYGTGLDYMDGGYAKLVGLLHEKDANFVRKFDIVKRMIKAREEQEKAERARKKAEGEEEEKKEKGFLEKVLDKAKEEEEKGKSWG